MLPAALCGVISLGVADIVMITIRRPISTKPATIPDTIGLHAAAEDGALRVHWNRHSRPIRNADHAILYVADGATQSQLDLSGRDLDRSSVRYWPESGQVTFRLEVYRGTQSSSDSAVVELPPDRARTRKVGAARAAVEQLRPSPFERLEPEIVQVQALPVPVAATTPAAVEPVAAPEEAKEHGLTRVISKIPLLRRLTKHSQSDENGQR
jgi:hypothetical protein